MAFQIINELTSLNEDEIDEDEVLDRVVKVLNSLNDTNIKTDQAHDRLQITTKDGYWAVEDTQTGNIQLLRQSDIRDTLHLNNKTPVQVVDMLNITGIDFDD